MKAITLALERRPKKYSFCTHSVCFTL